MDEHVSERIVGNRTGMVRSPGRTCSAGGSTVRSEASFCNVPVTTTTTGTVRGLDDPTAHPHRVRRVGRWSADGSVRRPRRSFLSAVGQILELQVVCAYHVVPVARPRCLVEFHVNRVGRGIMVDRLGALHFAVKCCRRSEPGRLIETTTGAPWWLSRLRRCW
jgi:hypothetical protein